MYRYDVDTVISCVPVAGRYDYAEECWLSTVLGVHPLDEPFEAFGGFVEVGDAKRYFQCAPTDSVIDDDVDLADVVAIVEHAGADVLGIDARRSSLATTSMSPDRHAAIASRSPGRARLVPVSPWST